MSPNSRFLHSWYVGSSCQWATVTPLVLPGHNKPRSKRAVKILESTEDLIRKSLKHANITQPCLIEFNGVSWWPGIPHAMQFDVRQKIQKENRARYHVKLTFEQPFAGPLSLGNERHVGLGVFAALDTFYSR